MIKVVNKKKMQEATVTRRKSGARSAKMTSVDIPKELMTRLRAHVIHAMRNGEIEMSLRAAAAEGMELYCARVQKDYGEPPAVDDDVRLPPGPRLT